LKAVLCKQYGPPESLVVEDIASPIPGPNDVVISVKAASVNFPDVLIIQNKYQAKPPLPFSPGSELSGIVKAVGADVSRWKPGDRVSHRRLTAPLPRKPWLMRRG
jgi:NADPH2:quinone reductase